MTDIDWSKAPEGASHYVIGWGFFKLDLAGWFICDDGEKVWRKTPYQSPDNFSWWGNAVARPTTPSWSGEGLPPVDYLKGRLKYDEKTGSLVWLARSESEFTEKHHFASWKSRCEGVEVGVVMTKKRKKYRRLDISGCKIYAHRVAWAIYYGSYPDGEIDHINGDSLDNSIENLREVSRQENCQNVKLQDNSRSGYCGVNWHEQTGKWRARVKINGAEKYIGLFDDPQIAAKRIKAVRDALGFHAGHGSPIRTPEQIAADERMYGMADILKVSLGRIDVIGAAYLYDAGYRKP